MAIHPKAKLAGVNLYQASAPVPFMDRTNVIPHDVRQCLDSDTLKGETYILKGVFSVKGQRITLRIPLLLKEDSDTIDTVFKSGNTTSATDGVDTWTVQILVWEPRKLQRKHYWETHVSVDAELIIVSE